MAKKIYLLHEITHRKTMNTETFDPKNHPIVRAESEDFTDELLEIVTHAPKVELDETADEWWGFAALHLHGADTDDASMYDWWAEVDKTITTKVATPEEMAIIGRTQLMDVYDSENPIYTPMKERWDDVLGIRWFVPGAGD